MATDRGPMPDTDILRLDIVVPVFDEAATLEASITSLHDHLTRHVTETWRITVADNASTDGTPALADDLARRLRGVTAVHLAEKGRGRALKQVWAASPADVLVYLDEDLSTDLSALGPLVAPLLSGHSDLAIGTRLSRSSRVVRGGKREFISRSYNLLLRRTMGVGFSDAQCGFKAIRREAAERLLPLVEDTGWFFDTELLILAERSGLRIHEVPVDWVDDPDSRSTSSPRPPPTSGGCCGWLGHRPGHDPGPGACTTRSGGVRSSRPRLRRSSRRSCGSASSGSPRPPRTRCSTSSHSR